ncbi:MAG: MFS transporter [Actinobacteria bacterium]|nr:MAG: MFS transporter [Actinomycetota bacterium]
MGERLHIFRAVMTDPNLRRVESAYLGFNMTEFATWIAILVYAFERGGAAEAGVVAVILLIPSAVVAPFAAYAGDRFRRDRVLLIDYLMQGVAIGATAVTLFVDAAPWLVYAAATIASISITLTRPAQNSLVPALTKTPDDLTATNVVTGVVEGSGKMLGPLAAGVLLGLSGPDAVFAVFAGVSLLGAVFVSRVRADPSAVTPPGRVDASDVWRQTLAGFATLAREREPRLVVLLLASSDIVVGALDVLFVATAIDLLAIGRSGAGYLSAAFGAGAVLGAAATVVLVGRRRLTPPLAAGAVVFGIPIGLVAVAPSAVSAPILFSIAGGGRTLGDVAGRTLLQRISPNEVLSRVFGVLEGLSMLALAVGSIGAAVLIQVFGVQAALVVIGAFLPLVILASSSHLLSIDRRAVAPDAEALALVRKIPFFTPLPAPAMERVMTNMTPVQVGPGEVLIREGDVGDFFYVIVEGEVEVTSQGKHLGTLGPGAYVGEIALLRDVPRTATVVARTPLRLLGLHREPFLLAVTGHPQSVQVAHAVADARLR